MKDHKPIIIGGTRYSPKEALLIWAIVHRFGLPDHRAAEIRAYILTQHEEENRS